MGRLRQLVRAAASILSACLCSASVAETAGYELQRHTTAGGGTESASPAFRLSACTIGDQCGGGFSSPTYAADIGYIPAVASDPPVQTSSIPNQIWAVGTSVTNGFDLDDHFTSPIGLVLSYTVSGSSQIAVAIDPATHLVSFSKPVGFTGIERVTFTAIDSVSNATDSPLVALVVTNPAANNPPVLDSLAAVIADEGELITLTPSATDPEGGPVSFAFSSPFNSNGTWQTGYGVAGEYSVTITASDGEAQDTLTVTVTVEDVNRPPVPTAIAPVTVNEGDLVVLSPHADDPDGQAVSFSYASPFNADGFWQTGHDDAGLHHVRVTASDGEATSSVTARVTVVDIDRPPSVTLSLGTPSANVDEDFAVTATGHDGDGDSITVTLSEDSTGIGSWGGNGSVTETMTRSLATAGYHTYVASVSSGGHISSMTNTIEILDPGQNQTIVFPIAGDFNGDGMTDVGMYGYETGKWQVAVSEHGSFNEMSDWLNDFGTKNWASEMSSFSFSVHAGGGYRYAPFTVGDDGTVHLYIHLRAGGVCRIGTSGANSDDIDAIGHSGGYDSNHHYSFQCTRGTTYYVTLTAPADGQCDCSCEYPALPGSGFYRPIGGDFNGDGKADIGIFDIRTGECEISLSNGNGFNPPRVWLDAGKGQWAPFSGDLNGDGLTDLGVYDYEEGTWNAAISDGSSFSFHNTWLEDFGGEDWLPMMADFNGDGLTDIGIFNKDEGQWKAALCTGHSFVVPHTNLWMEDFGADADPIIADVNNDGLADIGYYTNGSWYATLSTGTNFSTNTFVWLSGFGGKDHTPQTGDYNGDGLVDAAVYDKNEGGLARWRFRLSDGEAPDLVCEVDNGIGGKSTVRYAPSTSFDNTDGSGNPTLPFPMQCVISTTGEDGMGNSYTSSNSYSGGSFDTADREFRGFREVSATDPAGIMSKTWIHQDSVFKGRPIKQEVFDKYGQLYKRSTNSWDSASLYSGLSVFPYQTRKEDHLFDGRAIAKVTAVESTYDEYGNATNRHDIGDISNPDDDRYAYSEYVYNTNVWILGNVQRTWLTDTTGTKVAEKWFAYDNGAVGDEPTQGLLTDEEAWLDTGPNPVTSYEYDSYGNLIGRTDPRGYNVRTSYDPTFHQFAQTVSNEFGHVLHSEYDPRTGQVTLSRDPNNVETENTYDGFGRLLKVVGPYDTDAEPGVRYEYDITSFPIRVTKHAKSSATNEAAAYLVSYNYYDGLGRAIQTKVFAEEAGKQIISGTVHDHRGNPIHQYVPFLVAESTAYTPMPDPLMVLTTDTQFDSLGRAVKGTSPDLTFRTTSFDQWNTTVTDERGVPSDSEVDGFGRTIKRIEHNDGETYATHYAYDVRDSLKQVTDHEGNVTTISYDSLGRKTSMVDPDMGQWSYEYDLNGNLLRQTDAKGQVLEFAYDPINRLTRKFTGATTLATNIYDVTAEGYGVGRLRQVISYPGGANESAVAYAYDALGRKTKIVRTIDGTDYVARKTYDSLDRVRDLIYPDNEGVVYTYNRQGETETVGSTQRVYVANVDYNGQNLRTKVEFGNGTETRYEYHPQNFRLTRLRTTGSDGSIQDLRYTFDPLSNIKEIRDGINTASQHFLYDGLNRLVQASGDYGIIGYRYGATGNMTRRTDNGVATDYTYGENGAGPHAVTTLSGGIDLAVGYDLNGNVITKGNQTLTYDVENRLVEVLNEPDVPLPDKLDFTIVCRTNWNFFSSPLALEAGPIADLLFAEMGIDCGTVSRWDPSPGGLEHFVGDPALDHFANMEYGRGYEADMLPDGGRTVRIRGAIPALGASIDFEQGWNLFGAPYGREVSVSNALAPLTFDVDYDKVRRWDRDTGQWENCDTLVAGQAYAIHCARDCTWTIPRPVIRTGFVYDTAGARIKKITPLKTTTYIGSGYEIAGKLVRKHIFMGDTKVCTVETPATLPDEHDAYWVHGDHLGSSNVTTDESGKQIRLVEYSPFGKTHRDEGEPIDQYKFTGKELDVTTGFYCYGARYYDPILCRFLQADSFVPEPGNPQTLNRYSYCINNPLIYTDPSGNFFWLIGAIIGGIVGGISADLAGGDVWAGVFFGAFTGALGFHYGATIYGTGASLSSAMGWAGAGVGAAWGFQGGEGGPMGVLSGAMMGYGIGSAVGGILSATGLSPPTEAPPSFADKSTHEALAQSIQNPTTEQLQSRFDDALVRGDLEALGTVQGQASQMGVELANPAPLRALNFTAAPSPARVLPLSQQQFTVPLEPSTMQSLPQDLVGQVIRSDSQSSIAFRIDFNREIFKNEIARLKDMAVAAEASLPSPIPAQIDNSMYYDDFGP